MHHHDVTFNFGSAKVCSSVIFETYFAYHKDTWVAKADFKCTFTCLCPYPAAWGNSIRHHQNDIKQEKKYPNL